MFTKSNTFDIKPCSRVLIESDKDFTVYGLIDGDKVSVHPSVNRRLRLFPAEQVDALFVEIPDGAFYTFSSVQLPSPKEKPDPIPVELPSDLRAPLSLKEEMRRFIREEFSNYAQDQGAPSFEEEDDFDIPDDEPALFSPYEVQDMNPEPDLVDYDVDREQDIPEDTSTDSKDEPVDSEEDEQPPQASVG